MPLYEYSCECGKTEEHFGHIDDTTWPCECGKKMKRQISSRFGISMQGVPACGYYDENLQTYINSVSQKRRVMEEQGVSEKYGKGWR